MEEVLASAIRHEEHRPTHLLYRTMTTMSLTTELALRFSLLEKICVTELYKDLLDIMPKA